MFLWACNQQESTEQADYSQWYKGNLHTHSLWSDGDEFPENIMEWYKTHDYHFVTLSDHNILANKENWLELEDSMNHVVFQRYIGSFGRDWVEFQIDSGNTKVRLKTLEEYRPLFEENDRFLILQAEEISDKFENKPLHLNATNIEKLIVPQGGNSVSEVLQRNINAVLNQRDSTGEPMIVHINHPNFHYAITIDDMIALQGEQFFEVFNGHPMVYNLGDSLHMDTETMWDQINIAYRKSGKPLLFGLATDDSHHYHVSGSEWSNSGRGWIYVKADSLTPKSLIEAMEQGNFYASTGVELAKVEFSENTIYVEVKDSTQDYEIEFIGCLENESETQVLKKQSGYQSSYQITDQHLFVRARVTLSSPPANPIENIKSQYAWTQPVVYSE